MILISENINGGAALLWKEDDGSANEFPISADKTSDKVQEIEALEPMLSHLRKAQR
jgi:hypothetical protein